MKAPKVPAFLLFLLFTPQALASSSKPYEIYSHHVGGSMVECKTDPQHPPIVIPHCDCDNPADRTGGICSIRLICHSRIMTPERGLPGGYFEGVATCKAATAYNPETAREELACPSVHVCAEDKAAIARSATINPELQSTLKPKYEGIKGAPFQRKRSGEAK